MSGRPKVYIGAGFNTHPLALSGFNQSPLNGMPKWSNLSTRMYAVQYERGRENRLEDFLPGDGTIQLKNNDGQLTPSNPMSLFSKSNYMAAVLTDAPAIYLRLNEASGTLAGSEVGNGLPFSIVGSPTYAQAGLVTNDPNKSMKLGTSAAANAYLQTANTGGFGLGASWTLEMWINLASPLANDSYLMGAQDGATTFLVWVDFATSKLKVKYGATTYTSATGWVKAGTAQLVAVTYNSATSTLVFYSGGVVQDTFTGVALVAYGAVGTNAAFGAIYSAGLAAKFYGTMDEAAWYASAISATRLAAHAAATSTKSSLLPSLPVMVGTGFVGRMAIEGPSHFWSFDESTAAGFTARSYDQAGGLTLGIGSFKPTYNQAGQVGRGVLFDGVNDCLISTRNSTRLSVRSLNTTGLSVVGVFRFDKKAAFQRIVGNPTSTESTTISLARTTGNKVQLKIATSTGALTITTSAAISTGWHFVSARWQGGLKPTIRVDAARTSGSVSAIYRRSWQRKIAVGAETATGKSPFGGIVDELAIFGHRVSTATEDELYTEYQSQWKPGAINFRGAAKTQEPFKFTFPDQRDAICIIAMEDQLGRCSNVTIAPTGPSSSTSPPIKLFAGDAPGTRIGRILDQPSIVSAMRQLDPGASLLLGTSWGVNAAGEAARVARSENGAFFAAKQGWLRFDGRQRLFVDPRMQTAQSTFSDQGTSGLGYKRPQQGFASVIRNDVIVSNSTFSTRVTSTASCDIYGCVTTDRSDMLNQSANDLIEQGRFVLSSYSSALYAPTDLTWDALKSTRHFSAFSYRELRDRIKVVQQAPGTTAAVSANATIEKETVTMAKQHIVVTYALDSADRFGFLASSQLVILDSTVASRRLNSGRLGF